MMAPSDLSGQTVLLIGTVTDVAAGVAQTMHGAGASIVVAHRRSDHPPDLFDIPATAALEVTLDDPLVLAGEIAELSFQTVIISPGWFTHVPFMQMTPQDIDEALRLNFEYTTYATQAASRQLVGQGQGGSVILLSSVVSQMPFVHTNLAGVSLAAAEVIARMAAVDLGPHGIRVNVVSAGWLDGEWSRPLLDQSGGMHVATDIPLGKVGSTGSIGDACCFLASPLSAYVTGAVLTVDGGYLLTKSEGRSPYPGAE